MAKYVRQKQTEYEDQNEQMLITGFGMSTSRLFHAAMIPSSEDWVIGNWLDHTGKEVTRYPPTNSKTLGISERLGFSSSSRSCYRKA